MMVLAHILSVVGSLFFVISAIGMLRLPDFFCRVHAPTKAATLGVLLLGASAVLRSLAQGNLAWIEELLILVFLFLTIPISSQVLARSARIRRLDEAPGTTTGATACAPSPGHEGSRRSAGSVAIEAQD
jgi:multicomponent K+:H+ antiporter subunit G